LIAQRPPQAIRRFCRSGLQTPTYAFLRHPFG
jgi:hypothetical protein